MAEEETLMEEDREIITVQDSVDSLRKKFEHNLIFSEGCLKWFKYSESYFDSFRAKKLIPVIKCSELISGEIEYEFMEIFSIMCNLVFLHVLAYDEVNAMEIQTNSKRFLNHYRKTAFKLKKEDEYLDGVDFLHGSLDIFMMIQFNKDINSALLEQSKMKRFRDLHDKGKSIVLTFESRFNGDFIGPNQEIELIKKAIELDTSHWEWKLIYFKCLRAIRHRNFVCSKPKLVERQAVEDAFNLSPNPMCLFQMLECLAEFLNRENSRDESAFPIEFAGKYFSSEKDAVEFIKEKAEIFRKLHPAAGWMNRFAKLFTRDLPTEFRDKDLALSFLKSKLQVLPHCSRLHHRVGIFLCREANGSENDFTEAEKYFERAIFLNPNNKIAIFDYTKLIMRNDSKIERLKKFFETEFIHPTSEFEFYDVGLLFLKGYFYFVFTTEKEKALQCFLRWVLLIGRINHITLYDYLHLNLFRRLNDLGQPFGWKEVEIPETARAISIIFLRFLRLYEATPEKWLLPLDQLDYAFRTLQYLLFEAYEDDEFLRWKSRNNEE